MFDQRCVTCHEGEWGEGEWVSVDVVGTEPLVALSPARGTGGYRVPALLGFKDRKLSHEARVDSLEAWLNGSAADAGIASTGHALATTGSVLSANELRAVSKFVRAAF